MYTQAHTKNGVQEQKVLKSLLYTPKPTPTFIIVNPITQKTIIRIVDIGHTQLQHTSYMRMYTQTHTNNGVQEQRVLESLLYTPKPTPTTTLQYTPSHRKPSLVQLSQGTHTPLQDTCYIRTYTQAHTNNEQVYVKRVLESTKSFEEFVQLTQGTHSPLQDTCYIRTYTQSHTKNEQEDIKRGTFNYRKPSLVQLTYNQYKQFWRVHFQTP